MTNLKVTDMTAYADEPASGDLFTIVDVSDTTMAATGTNKKMTYTTLSTYLVPYSLFDAQTVLAATADNTPAALTVTEQTVVGRATGGNVTALAIDSDLSAVSANDDTIPSAKATKAYADSLSYDSGDITYTPGTATDWDGDADPGDLDDALDQLAERTDDLEGFVTSGPYPRRGLVFVDEVTLLAGAAISNQIDATQRYAFYSYQSTPADADSFTWSWQLAAGSYTLYLLGATGPNHCQMDVGVKHIDDISYDDQITGVEWYSAGLTMNVLKSDTLTLDVDGLWRFRALVNGKNVGSGNYYYYITKIWIKQSTD